MRIDHIAHPTRNPRETHRFYTTVLSLKLAQAYAGKDLMLLYVLPGGGSLVFSTGASTEPRANDADWERRHVGITVETRAEFEQWVRRLEECGVRFRLVENERVYFADPDGLVLELEVAAPMEVNDRAAEILAQWRG